jgi:hypothetical protein
VCFRVVWWYDARDLLAVTVGMKKKLYFFYIAEKQQNMILAKGCLS